MISTVTRKTKEWKFDIDTISLKDDESRERLASVLGINSREKRKVCSMSEMEGNSGVHLAVPSASVVFPVIDRFTSFAHMYLVSLKYVSSHSRLA